MIARTPQEEAFPVITGVSYFLSHVPSMVRYGSKPYRELRDEPSLLPPIIDHLRSFDQAVAYPPNQVFIGNLDPDELWTLPSPWHKNPTPNASRWGEFGEIMPEEEFYGVLKICDEFGLILIEKGFSREIASKLKTHPLFYPEDIQKLGNGPPLKTIEKNLKGQDVLPLFFEGKRLIGCVMRPKGEGAEEDDNLVPGIMLENLSARASGVMALRNLIQRSGPCARDRLPCRIWRGGGW